MSDIMVTVSVHHSMQPCLQATTRAWHFPLNHVPLPRLSNIARRHIFPGLTPDSMDTTMPTTCATCAYVNRTQHTHTNTSHQHHIREDLISSETLGSIQPPSQLHHRYVLTFVDATNRYSVPIQFRSCSYITTKVPATLGDAHSRPQPSRFHSDNIRKYHVH